jgi:iron-sulfur cluster assembly accessory protein
VLLLLICEWRRSAGVRVFVDPKALMHLIGTEMDFVDDRLKAEFTFTNPNSKGECGCGESFNV